MAVNVYNTGASSENLSRHEMIQWVNEKLSANFSKIEEMCQGSGYCQMIDMMFPGTIPIKKIKFKANLEHEFHQNLRLLQGAFEKLAVAKAVPIDRLIKGRFQDNFEFLQWFKKFFDANFDGKEYDALKIRDNIELGSGKPNHKNKPGTTVIKSKPMVKTAANALESKKSKNDENQIKELEQKIEDKIKNISTVELERDFYWSKMRKIEILCSTDETKSAEGSKILEILYASDEPEIPSEVLGSQGNVEEF